MAFFKTARSGLSLIFSSVATLRSSEMGSRLSPCGLFDIGRRLDSIVVKILTHTPQLGISSFLDKVFIKIAGTQHQRYSGADIAKFMCKELSIIEAVRIGRMCATRTMAQYLSDHLNDLGALLSE